MGEYIIKENKKLRTGITTGSCATAAAKAATIMLLSGEYVQAVSFFAKNGTPLTVEIIDTVKNENEISSSVIKDAGDDPDVTNGIKITATVFKINSGIEIEGSIGVGRVTRTGLKIPVGQAAINPVPLEMIEREVREVCNKYNYHGGIRIVISVPKGEEIAKKTMNKRLGIIGGISILGTTGIVEPMSDRAIIDTIKAEIDIRVSEGEKEIFVTPGNYGKDFARDKLNMDIENALKCSNFIGETLDYAECAGIRKILLIGHAGKLVKLAGGIMNTYGRIADCRMEIMAAHSAMCGMDSSLICKIMDCVTVDAAIDIIKPTGLLKQVWKSIGDKIGFYLRERTKGVVSVEYIVFTQEHGVLINSNTSLPLI